MENRRPSPYPTYSPPATPPTARPRRYRVEPPPGGHPVRDTFLGVAAAVVAAVVVAVVMVATVVVTRGTGTDPAMDRHRRPDTPPPTTTTPSADPSPDAPGEPVSKGWRLDTYRLVADGLGDFSGTAIVTNLAGRPDEVFVFTLLDGGRIVATLTGDLTGGSRGDQATVRLFSADGYQPGTFETRFQADY
ncbi:MAG: hypothetical protein ACJ73S_23455 [Mycobacteriales bacterium]